MRRIRIHQVCLYGLVASAAIIFNAGSPIASTTGGGYGSSGHYGSGSGPPKADSSGDDAAPLVETSADAGSVDAISSEAQTAINACTGTICVADALDRY